MATTTVLCNSFRDELAKGIHNFETDEIYVALFSSAAALSKATTAYSTTNEISGTAYPAGGSRATPHSTQAFYPASTNGDKAGWAFNNVVFGPNASFNGVKYALAYNKTKQNRAIAVTTYDDPGRSVSGADMTVTIPESPAGAPWINL